MRLLRLLRVIPMGVALFLSAPRLTTAFTFYQTHDGSYIDSITESQFLAASFPQLCHSPTGRCLQDCLNHTRLFQAVPDFIDATVHDYGQPHGGNADNASVTLFGLCTNFLEAHKLVNESSPNDPKFAPVRPFFAMDKGILGVDDPFRRVALGVAACVSDTCSQTRHPSQCRADCGLESLLKNDIRAIEWEPEGGMLNCTRRLCGSAQVLPYANQDVLGIGVLISYYIQGFLLLVGAFGVVVLLVSGHWSSEMESVGRKLKSPMATFLTAETYFSISTAIAAFIMSPREIDPLNGYALMVVAIVGFLCPAFTLLLLRCLGLCLNKVTPPTTITTARFGTILTLTSWLLNTIIFFLLLPNLSTFGENVAEDALKQLFSIPTCGGSSAMSLCQQLTGNNPLQSLTGFFEKSSWTNIRTVPVVWVLTTVILLVLVADHPGLLHHNGHNEGHGEETSPKRKPPKEHMQETTYSRLRFQESTGIQQQENDTVTSSSSQVENPSPRLQTGRLRPIIAIAFILLCSVGLGVTFHMLMKFRQVNAIDIDGWSFGQVIAAVFWVPVFLDVAHSMISG